MPIYRFIVKPDHQDPDMRLTHLPDGEAARRYARILIREFKASGRYLDPRSRVDVQDEMGEPVTSIPF